MSAHARSSSGLRGNINRIALVAGLDVWVRGTGRSAKATGPGASFETWSEMSPR